MISEHCLNDYIVYKMHVVTEKCHMQTFYAYEPNLQQLRRSGLIQNFNENGKELDPSKQKTSSIKKGYSKKHFKHIMWGRSQWKTTIKSKILDKNNCVLKTHRNITVWSPLY